MKFKIVYLYFIVLKIKIVFEAHASIKYYVYIKKNCKILIIIEFIY